MGALHHCTRAAGNIPILCTLGPIQLSAARKVSEKWGYHFQVRSTVFNRQYITTLLDLSTTSSMRSYLRTYIVYMSSSLHVKSRSHIAYLPAIHSHLISMAALVPWTVHIFWFAFWRPGALLSGIGKARSHRMCWPYAPWICNSCLCYRDGRAAPQMHAYLRMPGGKDLRSWRIAII